MRERVGESGSGPILELFCCRNTCSSILDSGVFCCLTLVDTESVVRQAGNRSVVPPPDRPPPRRCARVRSDVDAPHRPETASVPWLRHDSNAIIKTGSPGEQ